MLLLSLGDDEGVSGGSRKATSVSNESSRRSQKHRRFGNSTRWRRANGPLQMIGYRLISTHSSRKRCGGRRWLREERRAGGAALWGVPHKHCCKHRLPCSLHKYSIKRGWAADIPEIYCALWLRGILQMPNIFHVCGWKLRS